MLILASNTDKLQIATGSAGTIDAHASWMDNVAGAVAPGRTNTANINTAAVTTIVGSPAVGVQRNIKTLHIRNRSTNPNDITVIHSDGATGVELFKTTVVANGGIQYIDEVGFFVTNAGGGSTGGGSGSSGAGAGVGQWVLIEKKTITNPVPTVDFVKDINNTYDEFMVRANNVKFQNVNWIYLRVSNDGGVTFDATPNSYQIQYMYISPAVSPVFAGHGLDSGMQCINAMANASDRLGNSMVIQFSRPWDPTIRHMMLVDSTTVQESDGLARMTGVGEFFGNPFRLSTFNAIRFYGYTPAQFLAGTFSLFGIKR